MNRMAVRVSLRSVADESPAIRKFRGTGSKCPYCRQSGKLPRSARIVDIHVHGRLDRQCACDDRCWSPRNEMEISPAAYCSCQSEAISSVSMRLVIKLTL